MQVSRGPSTSVYGDRAMGGAVALWTPTPESRRIWTSAEGGSAGIADARGGYSDLLGSLGVSTMLRALRSDATHWTTHRIKKTPWPKNPIASQIISVVFMTTSGGRRSKRRFSDHESGIGDSAVASTERR